MKTEQQVFEALNSCYKAFSSLPPPRKLNHSPAIDDSQIPPALTSLPLQSIPVEDVVWYAEKALTTVGDKDDYRFFLPRILEATVTQYAIEPQTVANRLITAEWNDWPGDKYETVRDVFERAFLFSLKPQRNIYLSPSDWLCALAILKLDTLAFLLHWHDAKTQNAFINMAELINDNSQAIRDLKPIQEGYWNEADKDICQAITDFLISKRNEDYLMSAVDVLEDDNLWIVECALDTIEV